eukprot:6262010-Alexandrium_andersonii.AAC.1
MLYDREVRKKWATMSKHKVSWFDVDRHSLEIDEKVLKEAQDLARASGRAPRAPAHSGTGSGGGWAHLGNGHGGGWGGGS